MATVRAVTEPRQAARKVGGWGGGRGVGQVVGGGWSALAGELQLRLDETLIEPNHRSHVACLDVAHARGDRITHLAEATDCIINGRL